jgi:simple sugar transport system ATP-binding protein
MALDMSSTENVALRGAAHRRGRIFWSMLREKTIELAASHDVRGPVPDAPVRQLSGGNQQKLIVARELDGLPSLVVAENPTRGLDLRSTRAVHSRLLDARARGAAVVVYSSDVEELLSLADRVVVVHTGLVREVPLNVESVARALVGVTE